MIYQYKCKECELVLELYYESIPKKIPKYIRREHPLFNNEQITDLEPSCVSQICKGTAYRYYSADNMPAIQFKGLDFWTNRNKERKFYEKGYDKDHAQRFYKEAIKGSKERMKTGNHQYKRYEFTPGVAKAMGARRKTDKEVKDSLKLAKKLTEEAYTQAKNMGYKALDPTKPNFMQ